MSVRSLTTRAILSHIPPNRRHYIARYGPNQTAPILEWDGSTTVHTSALHAPYSTDLIQTYLSTAGYQVQEVRPNQLEVSLRQH